MCLIVCVEGPATKWAICCDRWRGIARCKGAFDFGCAVADLYSQSVARVESPRRPKGTFLAALVVEAGREPESSMQQEP